MPEVGNPAQWIVDSVGVLANRTRTEVSQKLPDSYSPKGLKLPANVKVHESEGGVFAIGSPEKLEQ